MTLDGEAGKPTSPRGFMDRSPTKGTKMKVFELLQELEGVDEDAEVRLAFQPNYPLEYETGRVAVVEPHKFVQNHNDDEDFECTFCNEPEDEHSNDEETIVYIGEGGQTWRAYLPGIAAHALGWG